MTATATASNTPSVTVMYVLAGSVSGGSDIGAGSQGTLYQSIHTITVTHIARPHRMFE